MTTKNDTRIVQSYLNFEGRCEEAIEFYRRALGAELNMMMRWKDSPEAPPTGCVPPPENKIMHAQIRIGETVVMLSDGRASGKPVFQGVSLSLTTPTKAETERYFAALSEGGQVQMPLAKTFFSEAFGMVADKFGVAWMVLVQPPTPK